LTPCLRSARRRLVRQDREKSPLEGLARLGPVGPTPMAASGRPHAMENCGDFGGDCAVTCQASPAPAGTELK
jgi:hypothetical protein